MSESQYSLVVDNLGRPVRAVTQFGYNAIEDRNRRQSPSRRVRAEDKVLTQRKRDSLDATVQEQARNYSILQWAIAHQVAYTASFRHSVRTGNAELDEVLDLILNWHGAPTNFDIGGRYGRNEAFDLMERAKTGSGDAALIKLPHLKLQTMESDLIRKASNYPQDDKTTQEVKDSINSSGLIVGEYSKPSAYSICNRGDKGNGYVFDHLEDAGNVIFSANWTRYGSQFRGVSELASMLNTVADLMEATEYNLLKAKMAALFGVAISRTADVSGAVGGAAGATSETADAENTADGSAQDLNPRAINMLDLNPGEKAEVIESKTPSTEFVNGCYLYIQLALSALSIPITAFDSRRSSFSGRIADTNDYEVKTKAKRNKNKYLRQEYSDWLVSEIWKNDENSFGLRKIAEAAGFSLMKTQAAIEWIPSGSPWLDKLKQVKGDELAIEIDLDNPIDAAKRRGSDAFDNVDKKLLVEEYEKEQREEKGLVPVETELSVDAAIGRVVKMTMAKATDEQSEQENDDDEK